MFILSLDRRLWGHVETTFFPTIAHWRQKERKKNDKKRKKAGLWKLTPLWKKAKRYAAFSHSGLDKNRAEKRTRFLPTIPTGPTTINQNKNGNAEGSGNNCAFFPL